MKLTKRAIDALEAAAAIRIAWDDEIKGFGPARDQRLPCPILDLGLKAAAAHRSYNPAIGIKERLGPDFLGTRSLHLRDDPQCDRLIRQGRSKEFVKRGHTASLAAREY